MVNKGSADVESDLPFQSHLCLCVISQSCQREERRAANGSNVVKHSDGGRTLSFCMFALVSRSFVSHSRTHSHAVSVRTVVPTDLPLGGG